MRKKEEIKKNQRVRFFNGKNIRYWKAKGKSKNWKSSEMRTMNWKKKGKFSYLQREIQKMIYDVSEILRLEIEKKKEFALLKK